MPADSMALASFSPSTPVCRERVVSVHRQEVPAVCVFANGTKLLLPRFLTAYIGDEITFPIPSDDAAGTEIYVTKNSSPGVNRSLYQAPIGYVSQPKQDKRKQYFVSAEVHRGSLGIGTIFLPCEVLREYFYRLPRTTDGVAIWNSNQQGFRTASESPWSGHSTSLVSRSSHPVRGLAYPGHRFSRRAAPGSARLL